MMRYSVFVSSLIVSATVLLVGCGSDATDPNPTDPTPLADLDDEFSSSASLSQWILRAEVEGNPSDGSVVIEGGQLLLHPLQNRYFLDANRGLSLFKEIPSATFPNFMIEAQVRAVNRPNSGPPTENFHSAGLVIYPNLDDMRDWVVTNIGLQNGSLGFEDKNTVDDRSVLTLYPTGEVFSGRVRLCVVGSQISVFTWLDGDGAWTGRNSFTHTMGTTIGAGVMINDYLSGNDAVEGQFEYVRFRSVASQDECTR